MAIADYVRGGQNCEPVFDATEFEYNVIYRRGFEQAASSKSESELELIPFIVGIVGIVGITITVALHATATSIIVYLLQKYAPVSHERFGRRARPFILGLTAAALAVKHFVDIVLWAIAYRNFAGVQQLEDFETAVYFSSVTYTSLGYGDIVLTGSWRILCGIQAMNGILLFGWSTAILFLLVQRMWLTDYKNDE